MGHISRIGIGYDVHRLQDGAELWLGAVKIPHSTGLIGHSDGDVVLHAVIDAMLGAAGLADIGEMFPDDEITYRGIASSTLLKKTMKKLNDKGLKPIGVDITIIAEQPRLGPYKQHIRRSLAGLLDVPSDRVGVKAKTNEALGFIGRGEGIACIAVVGLTEL